MEIKNSINDILSKQYLNNIVPNDILTNPISCITTGNMLLDKAIGGNEYPGIPKGRITEIFGNESCGKTTLTLQIAKCCTMNKKNVLYIDLEYALDINYVKNIGIDTNYFFVAHAPSGEIAFDIIENALSNQSFDLIVVDSVAAMLPNDEIDQKFADYSPLGAHARLMSRGIRKIQMPLSSSNTALVFINQIREKIGVSFGNPETTTGGKAIKYYASVRMEIKKTELIKDGQNKIGIKSKITIVKNKIFKPFGFAFMNIYFGKGFDNINDILEFAIEKKIITKNGSWFYFEKNKICQGFNQLKQYAKENLDWFNQITKLCLEQINFDS